MYDEYPTFSAIAMGGADQGGVSAAAGEAAAGEAGRARWERGERRAVETGAEG